MGNPTNAIKPGEDGTDHANLRVSKAKLLTQRFCQRTAHVAIVKIHDVHEDEHDQGLDRDARSSWCFPQPW